MTSVVDDSAIISECEYSLFAWSDCRAEELFLPCNRHFPLLTPQTDSRWNNCFVLHETALNPCPVAHTHINLSSNEVMKNFGMHIPCQVEIIWELSPQTFLLDILLLSQLSV